MTKTTESFIKKAIEMHGNRFDYSKVEYKNAKSYVIIMCKVHGEFEQRPNDHILNGKRGKSNGGCKKCSGVEKLTTSSFIQKAIQKYGNKYNYSKVEYKNAKSYVIITCKVHGEFLQTPNKHLSNYGCPKCGNIKSGRSKLKTTKQFIKKAISIHGNVYDYSNVEYKGAKNKVLIICKIHGEFKQTPDKHYYAGCSKCAIQSYSKLQISYLENVMKRDNIFIQHAMNGGEHKYLGYSADGYCKETNTWYMFHGDFWHCNPEIYKPGFFHPLLKKRAIDKWIYDHERLNKIKQKYNVIIMWENDYLKK